MQPQAKVICGPLHEGVKRNLWRNTILEEKETCKKWLPHNFSL